MANHSGSIPIRSNGGGWESNGTEAMDTVSVADVPAVPSADGQTVPAEAKLRRM